MVEDGVPQETQEALRQMGHDITGPITGYDRATFGRGHVITKGAWWSSGNGIADDSSVLWAGADSRSDGAALGY